MKGWKPYITTSGKTLKAVKYSKGIEHDIDLRYNKPVIHTNGKVKFVSTSDYIFQIDGEKEMYVLNVDAFESKAKSIKTKD